MQPAQAGFVCVDAVSNRHLSFLANRIRGYINEVRLRGL
ncbi:hypothetical protein OSCI_2780008 [Kamptonema sp. PCC 6506]|nr:hypothetical protein OSCI_2780008 [Kamptonema sp. PCC 6506]